MPNTQSAKKRLRQTERRTAVNRSRRSRVRTYVRKVEDAIASGDKQAAISALREVEPEIMRARSRGVIPMNTAARKVSRLSRRVNAMPG